MKDALGLDILAIVLDTNLSPTQIYRDFCKEDGVSVDFNKDDAYWADVLKQDYYVSMNDQGIWVYDY